MISKPLLSIGIPTYNREIYLKECLDSIINQEGFNELEIVISDNASSDNTKKLAEDYQKKYTNIMYHRHEKNIGATKNIVNLPNYMHGEYIWFLSDDDTIEDNKNIVQNIVHILKTHPLDILYINYSMYKQNMKDKIHENDLGVYNDQYFKSGIEFIDFITKKKNRYFCGFLSGNIIKKSSYNIQTIEQIKNSNKDIGFPHIEVFYENINQKIIYIYSKCCIKMRCANISWDIWKYPTYMMQLSIFFMKTQKKIKLKMFFVIQSIKYFILIPFYYFIKTIKNTPIYPKLMFFRRKYIKKTI